MLPSFPYGRAFLSKCPALTDPPDSPGGALFFPASISSLLNFYSAPQYVVLTSMHRARGLAAFRGPSGWGYAAFCMRTSMRRHILSRATWPPLRGRALRPRVLRAMLPSALSVSPLFFGDSVHHKIRLFGLEEGAAIFRAVSLPLAERMDQVRIAQSPYQTRSDRTRRSRTSRSRTASSGSSPPLVLL